MTEPKFPMGVPEWNLTTRMPVVQPGAELHQLVRDYFDKSIGVEATFPAWDEVGRMWKMSFTPEDTGVCAVRVWVSPAGSAVLHRFDAVGVLAHDAVQYEPTPAQLELFRLDKDDQPALLGLRAGFNHVLAAWGDPICEHLASITGIDPRIAPHKETET